VTDRPDGPCAHLEATTDPAPEPHASGCEDCLKTGDWWVHLRLCLACGHVGCCDSSPNRHATAHYQHSAHALARSFEPGENWFWCFADQLMFEVDGAPPAPSHP
jgi:uncharacterized UBP type Zn finger protein